MRNKHTYIIIAFAILLSIQSLLNAQTSEGDNIGQYKWVNVVVMEVVDIDGNTSNPVEKVTSLPGQIFNVISEIGTNHLLIQILNYKEEINMYKIPLPFSQKENLNYEKYNVGSNGNRLYFKVTKAMVANHARPYKMIGGSLAFGVINFPFKLRPQKGGDFSGSFNLGTGIGYKFPNKSDSKFKVSLLLGSSLSIVNIDPSSVKRNEDQITPDNDEVPAVSISLGLMLEYEKIQVGAFSGLDYIGRASRDKFGWIYQSKPWFSLALGISIFSTGDAKEVTKN